MGAAMLCRESLEEENVEKPQPFKFVVKGCGTPKIHNDPKAVPPTFEVIYVL